MKTTDLFKNNRAAKRINESLAKTFGRKLNLESFDLPQLEDARNKLRTQIHTARTASGFNENLENEAFTEAQWMLDAINSEIAEREEFIADAHTAEAAGEQFAGEAETLWIGDDGEEVEGVVFYTATVDPDTGKLAVTLTGGEVTGDNSNAKVDDAMIQYLITDPDYRRDYMQDAREDAQEQYNNRDDESEPEPDFDQEYNDESIGSDHVNSDEKMKRMGAKPLSTLDKLKMMPRQAKAMARGDSEDDLVNYNKMKAKRNEAYDEPEAPDAEAIARRKRLQAIKDRQEDERDSGDDTKSNVRKVSGRAYGGAAQKDDPVDEAEAPQMVRDRKTGKQYDPDTEFDKLMHSDKVRAQMTRMGQEKNKGQRHNKNESIQGDNMATLREGEIQQAQSIVTAKTMVDRVGRWIEELSGMENDTLLQLGDQIRDEQGQEQAKGFISSVAPAIQQALDTLKGTREALASGVRTLTGEEQGAEMLGGEPEAAPVDDFGGAAEPDAMNAEEPMDDEVPADDFAAAEPAAGGVGDAGRMKRESVEFGNSLLKVLAG